MYTVRFFTLANLFALDDNSTGKNKIGEISKLQQK